METVTYKDTSFNMEPLYETLSLLKSRRPRKSLEACFFSILRRFGKMSYQASSFAVFRTVIAMIGSAGTFSRIDRTRTNSRMIVTDDCSTGRWRTSG